MSPLPTKYARAERATELEIRHDAELYVNATLVNSMLDAVPDILLILNEERQAVFVNEACVLLLNLTDRDQALGQRPGELIGCVHSTETQGGCGTTEFCRTCGAINSILSSQQGHKAVQECRITLRDGSSLDLRASTKPLELDNRQFTVFTLSDISGEKRRRALERIFFHDVLNTAGVVSMSADLMRHSPEDVANLADDLYHVSRRLIDEIRSQQDLMTAENGELVPHPSLIGVSQFMHDITRQYRNYYGTKDRIIEVIAADEALVITCDRTLLGRVIGNMIKNAIEATQSGDTVTLSCATNGAEITFAVHNPNAMPRDVQLQVFNRSFSTKGAGRGLGTYSMRLLSERYLSGQVRFTSNADEGTTFYATYPIESPLPVDRL